MKKILTFLTVLIVLLTACTKKEETCTVTVKDGVSTYQNKDVKSAVAINAKKVFSLTAADSTIGQIGLVAGDRNGNLFIMDFADNQIKKIDSNGKLITKFGGKGTGPGEYAMVAAMEIVNNKLVIVDAMQQRMVFFDLDGKFINFVSGLKSFPVSIKAVGKDQLLGLLVKPEPKEDGMYITTTTALLDSAFQETKSLNSFTKKIDMANPMGFQKSFPMITTSSDKIYMTSNSQDHYAIDTYDTNGKLVEKISKNFLKIAYTQAEIDKIQSKITAKLKAQGVPMEIKFEEKFKSAINWIGVDHYNRLWIAASTTENKDSKISKKYEIFENGKLLGTADFPADDTIYFIKDRLIDVNTDENTLSVYSY